MKKIKVYKEIKYKPNIEFRNKSSKSTYLALRMKLNLDFLNKNLLEIIKYKFKEKNTVLINLKLKKAIKDFSKGNIYLEIKNPPYYSLMNDEKIIINKFMEYGGDDITELKNKIKLIKREEKIKKMVK